MAPADDAREWPRLHVARREAAARGSSSVGTQHLLLALLCAPADADGTTLSVLRAAGVNTATVSAALEVITGTGGARPAGLPVDAVPVSPRVDRLLEDAAGRAAPSSTAPRDRDVLRALLESDDPSIGRLVVTYVGSPAAILQALDADEASLDAG